MVYSDSFVYGALALRNVSAALREREANVSVNI